MPVMTILMIGGAAAAHVERYVDSEQRRRKHQKAIERPNSCTITPL